MEIYPNLIGRNEDEHEWMNVHDESEIKLYRNDMFYNKEYLARLSYAREIGADTVVLTAIGEPQQNMEFIRRFAKMNQSLSNPFKRIEIKTTGAGITKKMLQVIIRSCGINTVTLLISSFNDDMNANINGTTGVNRVDLEKICSEIRELGGNLKLHINLTNEFDVFQSTPWALFKECRYRFNASQVVLSELYADPETDQGVWVEANGANPKTIYALEQYLIQFGTELVDAFSKRKYAIHDMGVSLHHSLLDKDFPSQIILRPNCKLYTRWSDPGSLIF